MADSPRKGSLLVIFLIVFIDLLGFGMVLPLLPIYAKQFSADEHGLLTGLLMSSFSAMQFLFSPFWGKLSDRLGRRPVLMVGLAGSTLFYGLFGVATMMKSITLLFVARIGAGIAGATISTAQAYIADSTTLQNRTKGMALIGAAFGLGFTFGPLLGAAAVLFSEGGASASDIGASPWPGYVAAILSGISLLLSIRLLPESLTAGSQTAERHGWSLGAWRDAFTTPTVGVLLLVSFISVLAFGGFESTLSLLLKDPQGGFEFRLRQVLLMFAFIGIVLTIVQGGLVRRLSGKVADTKLAAMGSVLTMIGFGLLIATAERKSFPLLLFAAAVQVSGFAFVTPSLQSLISRRSDPAKQGAILGVSQSVSALARIAAPMLSIWLFHVSVTLPYWVSAGLIGLALLLLLFAARQGTDFATSKT